MLDRMREGSKGVAAKIILAVLILSFALAGVSSYIGTDSNNTAVTVNGEEISQQRVEQAFQNEKLRLQQQYGEQFDIIASDPSFTSGIRNQVTQTLIIDHLITQTVDSMGLRVSDKQLINAIHHMPEFQVEGKFDNDLYLSLLRTNNFTPAAFSANLKLDFTRKQLFRGLIDSEFVLPLEIDQAFQLEEQQRVAKILDIKRSDFKDPNSINAAEISAFYTENRQYFQDPEQVSVEYIVLDSSLLAPSIKVTDKDIQTYYDQHKAEYQRAERRKVAQIYVQGDSEEAKNKAQAILAEVNAGGDFVELVKAKSEDELSANNNGELDWFERGVIDPAFDESAFSLTESAPISGVVKSKFGYHIIKLVDVQESKTLPLNEVKSKIEVALQHEKVKETYDDLYQRLSEVAYESPDNLKDASSETGLTTQTSDLFSAQNAPDILNNRAILDLVFNEDFRNNGLNSDIIQLGDSKSIVVRAKDHKMPEPKALADVSEQIKLLLEDQKSAEAAKIFVESLVAKLAAGESVESELVAKNLVFSPELTLKRDSTYNNGQAIDKLFQLAKPAAGKTTLGYVATAQGDYAVIELSAIIEATTQEMSTETEVNLTMMLENETIKAMNQALITYLLSNADIVYATPENE